MINVFLTGVVGVGKSTVIQKVLALLPSVACGGFRTVSSTPITEGARFDVFIESVWEKTHRDSAHLAGTRWGDGRFTPYPETFDTVGASILSSPPVDAALILMDELGFMESNAALFRQAVLKTLDGIPPVLGVIKPKHSEFLDAVRAHSRSKVFEVTGDNRDILPFHLAALLLATTNTKFG